VTKTSAKPPVLLEFLRKTAEVGLLGTVKPLEIAARGVGDWLREDLDRR